MAGVLTPKASWPWVKTLLHSIYDQPDAHSVVAQYDRVLDSLAEKLPKVVAHLEENRADVPAFTAFPRRSGDKSGLTFAWICDVFVDENHRGRGLGTWLVESIAEDLSALGVQRFHLATRDAHEVYRRCGFVALKGADRWMEIDRRPTRAAVLGLDPV